MDTIADCLGYCASNVDLQDFPKLYLHRAAGILGYCRKTASAFCRLLLCVVDFAGAGEVLQQLTYLVVLESRGWRDLAFAALGWLVSCIEVGLTEMERLLGRSSLLDWIS